MKPKTVSVRGLIGVRDGLGVDQVDLDVSGLAGVVALTGPNGSAKTTLLESLQPWRFFPSRKVGLKEAVNLRDSHKDLVWEMDGHTFRSLCTIDCHTGKADGYLYCDGEPLTTGKVTEHDERLVELLGTQDLFFHSAFAAQSAESLLSLKPAKRKEFFAEFLGLARYQEFSDKAREIVGFLAGVIDGRKGDINRLTREVDGLSAIEQDLVLADKEHGSLLAEIEDLKDRLTVFEEEQRSREIALEEQKAIAKAIEALNVRLEEVRSDYEAAQGRRRTELSKLQEFYSAAGVQLSDWRVELGQLRAESVDIAAAELRVTELREEVHGLELRQADQNSIRKAIVALESRLKEMSASHERAQSRRHAELNKLREFEERASREIAQKQIDLGKVKNAPSVADVDTRIAGLEQELAEVDKKSDAANAIKLQLMEIESAYERDRSTFEARLKSATGLAALADKIPIIADRDVCAQCGFASAAVKAAGEQATISGELESLKAAFMAKRQPLLEQYKSFGNGDLAKQREAATAELRDARSFRLRLEAVEGTRKLIEQRLEQVNEAKARLRELTKEFDEAAADFESRRQTTLAEIAAESSKLDPSLDAVVPRKQADLVAANELLEAARTKARRIEWLQTSIKGRSEQAADSQKRLEAFSDEINAAHSVFTDRQAAICGEIDSSRARLNPELPAIVQRGAVELTNHQRKLDEVRTDSEKVAIEIGVLQQQVARCNEAASELEQVRAELFVLDEERADWLLLQQICGRDKLQALELDAAAPAVTSIANNLLSECFGGQFSIQFETMNEKGQEVFDLIVTDLVAGDSSVLTLKSGGQKLIVLMALRLAVTIYAKEQSRRDFRTLFCDEVDGALDPEARGEFVSMLRSAMRLGGFDTTFLITHSQEVIERVDRKLVFGNGKISIQ